MKQARVTMIILVSLLLAASPLGAAPTATMTAAEQQVVAEMSLARTRPAEYAKLLRELRARYQGKIIVMPNGQRMMTNEGVAAVDEAIAFLERQTPLGPLTSSNGLALAARDHVRDQGPKGAVGHSGSDGSQPADRLTRHGQWQSAMGENIAYGFDSPRDIVMQLIVDDGVPDRGHRKNIFNPAYQVAGVAIGPHARFRAMCVIDLAGGFRD